MTKVQNDNLRKILDWLETCPIQYSITSMSGDCVFIRCMDTSKNTFEEKEITNACPPVGCMGRTHERNHAR